MATSKDFDIRYSYEYFLDFYTTWSQDAGKPTFTSRFETLEALATYLGSQVLLQNEIIYRVMKCNKVTGGIVSDGGKKQLSFVEG